MAFGERITTAAIRVGAEIWTLPRPARHHVLIAAWGWAHYGASPGRIDLADQGFMTSAGRFVGRSEAAKIARDADQLLDRYKGVTVTSLTTEYLW